MRKQPCVLNGPQGPIAHRCPLPPAIPRRFRHPSGTARSAHLPRPRSRPAQPPTNAAHSLRRGEPTALLHHHMHPDVGTRRLRHRHEQRQAHHGSAEVDHRQAHRHHPRADPPRPASACGAVHGERRRRLALRRPEGGSPAPLQLHLSVATRDPAVRRYRSSLSGPASHGQRPGRRDRRHPPRADGPHGPVDVASRAHLPTRPCRPGQSHRRLDREADHEVSTSRSTRIRHGSGTRGVGALETTKAQVADHVRDLGLHSTSGRRESNSRSKLGKRRSSGPQRGLVTCAASWLVLLVR
ncbi:hypothetical protein EHYA_02138 [Embleya hyalina]|uniref:Uncharacterized protein n=1 Tax=Embleya hyalina TaxID=516124 RepID=A0A401YIW7_9ACTN|nr:hypothetical protein EHYA_02138 [Embleya hyalina]